MKPLEILKANLVNRFPMMEFTLDMTETKKGSSFLDIRHKKGSLLYVVESKDQNFGIHSQVNVAYGEKPDLVFEEAFTTLKYLIQILSYHDSI